MPDVVYFLQAARVGKNITQEQLGNYLGVSKQTISAWETKKRKLPLDKAITWAKYLGVSLDATIQ